MSPRPGSNGNGGTAKFSIQRIPPSHDYIRRDGAGPKDGWAKGPADPGAPPRRYATAQEARAGSGPPHESPAEGTGDEPRTPTAAVSLRPPARALQLLVPRRRQPHRGAGRPGGRPGAAGPGPHRPRRPLRRGALRQGLRQARHQAHLRSRGAGGVAAARRRRGGQRGRDAAGRAPDGRPADPHHLVLLAETREGYANLCRLISAAHLADPERERPPLVTLESLRAHADGLICLTGCRHGEVGYLIDAGRDHEARAALLRLREHLRARPSLRRAAVLRLPAPPGGLRRPARRPRLPEDPRPTAPPPPPQRPTAPPARYHGHHHRRRSCRYCSRRSATVASGSTTFLQLWLHLGDHMRAANSAASSPPSPAALTRVPTSPRAPPSASTPPTTTSASTATAGPGASPASPTASASRAWPSACGLPTVLTTNAHYAGPDDRALHLVCRAAGRDQPLSDYPEPVPGSAV